ncbi:hypothetical protein TRP8649_04177 [Pelagimonas phthalicica]|uniref:DUF6680 domain-containing protein n=1 Tax=Pelagimonas phthalicica TaxID=1037362 RepID=A0A238JIR8_9RHOB|nr:DUF6680 family protein [Pelagimonas phthalicica]TDS89870.1 hypothetical protein CLV87_3922 [Pelagimonas phthalicica]SMX30037.1 hypothetical protein TRP8649_04177 [Pelagimonas phthalicica]
MILDYTIRLTDVAIVIAALLGPVLAVQAQKFLERRRDIKERRLAIFRILMATRAAMLSPQHVEALNAVPVEFYGSCDKLKKINEAWKLYLDHHDERYPANEAWAQKRHDLFLDLLHLISQFLGYTFSRAQLGRDIYSPKAHGDLETEQTIIRKGLVDLFKGDFALPLAVKEFPNAAPGNVELKAALQQGRTETMQRSRPLDPSRNKTEGNKELG